MAFPLAAWRIGWVWSTTFGVKLTAAFDEISDLHRPAPLLAVPEVMVASEPLFFHVKPRDHVPTPSETGNSTEYFFIDLLAVPTVPTQNGLLRNLLTSNCCANPSQQWGLLGHFREHLHNKSSAFEDS
jgi:hypothetical protein